MGAASVVVVVVFVAESSLDSSAATDCSVPSPLTVSSTIGVGAVVLVVVLPLFLVKMEGRAEITLEPDDEELGRGRGALVVVSAEVAGTDGAVVP